MIITDIQKKEIERLIPEHGEVLVAYGADFPVAASVCEYFVGNDYYGACLWAAWMDCDFLAGSASCVF